MASEHGLSQGFKLNKLLKGEEEADGEAEAHAELSLPSWCAPVPFKINFYNLRTALDV